MSTAETEDVHLGCWKAGVCYFHDLINDYYTIEHPLTQRPGEGFLAGRWRVVTNMERGWTIGQLERVNHKESATFRDASKPIGTIFWGINIH